MCAQTLTFPPVPILIAHDRVQALAGFAAAASVGCAAQVETPAELAAALGPMWMRAFLDALTEEHRQPPGPVVFHCGDSPGLAQAAIHLRLPDLRLEIAPGTPPRVIKALGEIAADAGSHLMIGPPPAPCWRFPPPGGRPDHAALIAAAAKWLSQPFPPSPG
jgi:hypothetical protein